MNYATRAIVTTLSVVFGISGMNHGLFETLQGNTPTDGMFISAIGDAQRMWPHGNEPAFTLIPNFLWTGIAAMLVGLAIIIWSVGFVHKKNGPIILLALFVLLLLVGGGVAQILFFPWICLVSTQINSSLLRWRKIFPARIQAPFGKLWLGNLLLGSTILLFVLEIATTGFIPAVNNPQTVISVMLLCLAAEVVILPFTILSGFAHDVSMMSVTPATS